MKPPTTSPPRRSLRRHLSAGAVAGVVLLMSGGVASGTSACFGVRGKYEERVNPTDCESPVALCIDGELQGSINGSFSTTVTSIIPTADTPETNVLAFTADTTMQARIRGREGELFVKNAGTFETTGDGNIVDVQAVVGGTGELSGASGVIRATGLFDSATGTGASDYEGKICLAEG